ncbi:bacteriohemerythrin [Crassaminicella profunda]|uniref:bacteriohemerythrin n=1 Tax=Crassaminicella profunda TaxID=1286698 RepID=UPI001CA78132|nr:bacteriohemerythrin [Crassaminicella profunda]QZY55043.1 bacteriohemerythrin [Crassaminicella profunda]
MFEWKSDYKVHIAEIDQQHKKLLQIGGRLVDLLKLKDDIDHYDEIIEILRELREYTEYHFAHEEKLLEKYGYQQLRIHKRQHKSFVNKIIQLENQDIDEKQKGIELHMIEFLANWIENHILKTDHEYEDFLHEKDVY